MIDEPTLSDFFHILDMAVMERMDDGSFQLIGGLPDCLTHFFPETLRGEKGFRPDEKFPFLENFLFDAEDCWADGSTEKLKSGPWTETDLLGNDYEFEAVAISSGKKKLLLIEPARYSYEEKQTFIQKSRELSLAYHRLEKTEAELKKAKEVAEDANRKIISSIQYAHIIQRSLLSNPENIKTFLPDSFFIWRPRDIVGGDFIFMDYLADGLLIAVIDCTGHGVPGAFMTMIVSFGLRKIIKDEGCYDPARILKRLSFLVKTTLQQDTEFALSDDGLDAAICFIDGQWPVVSGQLPNGQPPTDNKQPTTNNPQLTFAGAKLPLFYFYNDKVTVIKGDRQSIGYKRSDLKFDFTNHTVPIRNGISFYMASDGFTDQLDREDRRRFGTRRFRKLITSYARLPFEKQRDIFLRAFHEHKGENEVQDDVTVVGFGFREI